MSNIIEFGQTETETDTMPTYELSYVNPVSGDIITETFTGDAVMTQTFVGVIGNDQVLQFAVNMDNLLSLRQLPDATETTVN